MCTIEIEVLQPGTQEPKAIRFGEVFKCDDNSYLAWIPITIFKYYNISPSVANALLDRTLSETVMQEAGIEFTYKHEID